MFGSAAFVSTEVGEFLLIFLTTFNNWGYEKVAGESDAPTLLLLLFQALFFIKCH